MMYQISWKWIFVINIKIGIEEVIMGMRRLKDNER